MRLFYRFVISFLLLVALSTGGLGAYVRQNRREAETARYFREVEKACVDVRSELERQGESDERLVAGACEKGEFVDRVAIAIERNDETSGMMVAGRAQSVPRQRVAFGLDELMLVTSGGDVLGADPQALVALPRDSVSRALRGDATRFGLRLGEKPAIVTRCSMPLPGGRSVGFVGAHHLLPLLDRFGKVLDVKVTLGPAPPRAEDTAVAACTLNAADGTRAPLFVAKSKVQLYESLRQIDSAVLTAAIGSAAVAFLLAIVLARRIGGPIAELAAEARKVATDEARPIRVRGSGEIADLARAFDKMLEDLAATQRRLAATSRVAAWREVARRVAHEVKNPLAPIRAAVETLRRLRARDDPAFDGYFDEATRTVLDEVHRISNIVTEFTRFARLPPPRPVELDLTETVQGVLRLHEAGAASSTLALEVVRSLPKIRADRDQVVQVLTNLVQNALDAVRETEGGAVTVSLDHDGGGHVSVTVSDNGPGIAKEIQSRLFEPYATTKATGTGLGLAIAQRIAIEHEGELSLLPGKGRGASFRFVLPVKGPELAYDAKDPEAPSLPEPPG